MKEINIYLINDIKNPNYLNLSTILYIYYSDVIY